MFLKDINFEKKTVDDKNTCEISQQAKRKNKTFAGLMKDDTQTSYREDDTDDSSDITRSARYAMTHVYCFIVKF